jgi:hypothetical protein
VPPDSVESAKTTAGRALVTYSRSGTAWGFVIERSGAIGTPRRLGRGVVTPYAGADGSLFVVQVGDGVTHWLRRLAPAQRVFASAIPLPEPGGSFRVASAAIGSDGTAYVAEVAEFGGTGLVVWAQRKGPVVALRYLASVRPPLLLRRPWMALVADPRGVDDTVQLVPTKRGGRVLALWDRSSGRWQNPMMGLEGSLLRSSASPTRTYGRLRNGNAMFATPIGNGAGLRLVWDDAAGVLHQADPARLGSSVIARSGAGAATPNVAVNAHGQETIVYLQVGSPDALSLDAVAHA